jgi:hypothetical protein
MDGIDLILRERYGSVENIVFHNVLGGINCRWKARIDWRNHINGFDMFAVPKGRANWRRLSNLQFVAVPAGKGKLKKMSVWTSSRFDGGT